MPAEGHDSGDDPSHEKPRVFSEKHMTLIASYYAALSKGNAFSHAR